MVMHKTHDTSVFDMLMEAMEVARQGNRVTEERNIQVLIGQMHIVQVKLIPNFLLVCFGSSELSLSMHRNNGLCCMYLWTLV